jgi:GT2 family glycosyltransferase
LLDKLTPPERASKFIEPTLNEELDARATRLVANNRLPRLARLAGGLGRVFQRSNGKSPSELVSTLSRSDDRLDQTIELQSTEKEERLKRPHVRGKFLFVGDEKFWVRGVTYGTFRPDETGAWYPHREVVERDFKAMKSAGLNAVRVYTVPPPWLLDLAASNGLRLMIGLHWEQRLAVAQNVGAFLNDKAAVHDAIVRIGDSVRQCANHPAVLCYTVGNEIPAYVVRWYGERRIRNFLTEVARVVRREDPEALLAYPNYPTTEYLDLPFVDFVAFNVYLESREQLSAYLARLQNLAGERPLVLTETGLDSLRNGADRQAATLEWQLETIFEGGCGGAFVYAWTDEWHCGGRDVEDWDFGLTTRDRRAKPALASVARAFRAVPFGENKHWPRISVVVCSYNGAATIDETLTALGRLNYEDYEVIVVDDGSTDDTASIVRTHGIRLIQTENKGLSNARNVGMEAATGKIIAYIDDDAYPDPDWLKFLAALFMRTDHAGVGGPNIAPSGDGLIADCVAHAPGGPVHVLLSDEVAEHIPGCNMAFNLDRLRAIGGFDTRFKVAGDDVDICWRMQDRGWTLGFSPAAMVWHHRRRSIREYWKQQKAYAKAESLLVEKWPQKYNTAGHLNWSGRLYGNGVINFFLHRSRIYHGTWGRSLFQSVYEPAIGVFSAIPLMPEWYVLIGLLGALSALGLAWPPLLLTTPFFILGVAASLIQAQVAAAKASLEIQPPLRRLSLRILIASLHLIQPFARLLGRIRHGVGPWRWPGLLRPPVRLIYEHAIWSEQWQPIEARLARIEKTLLRKCVVVKKGGDFDRWDLEVRGGLVGCLRAMAMLEEHGSGKQLFRLRVWPRIPWLAIGLFLVLCLLAALAARDQAWLAALALAAGALAIAGFTWADCAKATRRWRDAINEYAVAEFESNYGRSADGAESDGETGL